MADLRDLRICNSCRESQLEKRELPRVLKKLPTTTAGTGPKKTPLPVYACEFCDGPAFERAVRWAERQKRLRG